MRPNATLDFKIFQKTDNNVCTECEQLEGCRSSTNTKRTCLGSYTLLRFKYFSVLFGNFDSLAQARVIWEVGTSIKKNISIKLACRGACEVLS